MTRNEKILIAYSAIFAVIIAICICGGISLRNQLDENEKLLEITNNELFATQQDLGEEMKKVLELNEKLEIISENLDEANETVTQLKGTGYDLVYLGDFKITHYCAELRPHICGTGAGITASGTTVTPGRTVAVDPDVIPYGTYLYIEGYGWRIAEDCGGAVKDQQIDVAVQTHVDALALGVQSKGVWVIVKIES